MKKLLTLWSLLICFAVGAWADDALPLTLTFPDYNDASVNNYTAEWTATVDGKKWTLNGFNNNENKWSLVKCGRRNYAHTATITSPAVDAVATNVVYSVGKTGNIESVKFAILNGDTEVSITDITDSWKAGDINVPVTGGQKGYSYKLTVNSTSASSNGTTEITKIAIYGEGQYVEKHIANTIDEPYTVAKAFELVDAGEALSDVVYVKGVISQIDDKFNATNGTNLYWISDDGKTDKQLEVYNGLGLDGAKFTSKDDIELGATVIVKGNLKKYGTTYEFDANNQLASYTAPAAATGIVYDFAAEQALIAAGTVAKPGNVGGNQSNGQGFNAYKVKIRNDYKGYSKVSGSTLPETCNIWRRTDRFDQDASWNTAGGVLMPNDREFAIDGLTPGSKVVIEYDATNAADDSKNIIWAVGENNKLGEAVDAGTGIPVATATIGGIEAVPGETAIASGAEILVKSVTPAVKGTGYIVIQVKKNMVISKISILVNEDAVSNAVTVSEGIENGTVKVNRTTAFEGDEVYVTATPAEGYELEAITVKDADNADVTVTDGKFIMPAKAVTVTATFTITDAINSINADATFDANAPKYNLAGQKVGKSYKGIVIVNGKKYIQK